MTRTTIIVTVLGVIAVAICLWRIKSKQLPKKYKDYKYIWDILQTEKYEIVPFNISNSCDSPIFDSDNNIIISTPTGGSGSPNLWSGVGFIKKMLNGDTLRIKMDMEELSANNSSYAYSHSSPYFLYYVENCDFFILERNELKLYLIKPKEYIK